MFLIMIVSLYTVRVTLVVLGEVDYGINNVVGGIVVMFSFMTQVLSSASQRFFSYSLGQQDYIKLSKIFSVMLMLYGIMCIIIVLISETIGLWLLYNKMTIPEDRMLAANVVFQFSILSFCWKIFTAPHQAIILAHERMGIYAYVGMADVILRLLVVFAIQNASCDRLILLSILHFLTLFIVNATYIYYSKRSFPQIRFIWEWDKEITKNVVTYSGWTLFGMLSVVARSQGINIVLNIFFTPVVNAARAIAHNVNSSVASFSGNFYTAVKPQIVKYYAAGDLESCYKLISRSTKFSYYLILLFVIPIITYTPNILELWLGSYPENTVVFTRLVLVTAVIDSMANPITSYNQATGSIKWFQIIVGTLLILNVPITILVLYLGSSPVGAFWVSIAMSMIAMAARLLVSYFEHQFPLARYLRDVTLSVAKVTLLCVAFVYIYEYFNIEPEGFVGLMMNVSIIAITVLGISYYFGFNSNERKYAYNMIKSKIQKK